MQDSQRILAVATDVVFNQQEAYNNIMRADTHQFNAERDVFHKFFAQPQTLLHELKALEAKKKLKSVSPGRSPRKTPRSRRAVPINFTQ